MSFDLNPWLRGVMVGLSRNRRGPTIRREDNRHRRGVRLRRDALGSEEVCTIGLTSFAPSAYVIATWQPVQTFANSLKPYAMVWDLVQSHHIPVDYVPDYGNPTAGWGQVRGGTHGVRYDAREPGRHGGVRRLHPPHSHSPLPLGHRFLRPEPHP